MQSSDPSLSQLAAENARLREQIASLTEQAQRFEARLVEEVVAQTAALRKSEALLAESQRMARIGSFELDVRALELTWTDQQFRNFGLEPAPVISRAEVTARIDPRDLAYHESVVLGGIATGEPFALDYRVVHPDGTVRIMHTIGQPVRDGDGRVLKVVGTSQDVTELRHLEEALRAQYEQLKQVDHLKSSFVNSVTHELRTPLASIVGYAEFLEDESVGPINAQQQAFVQQILAGAKRLEFLLNDLLDYARIEAGKFTLAVTRVDLSELVRQAIASLLPQADAARLALVGNLPDEPLALEIDARRIGQVLTNLIANAIKFAPMESEIRVTAQRTYDGVRCEVEDAGPGIAAEDLPRLFQRFSQLEAGLRIGKGTGLGLAISKSLVEAHGGAIGVESTPGVGSRFWFELPCQKGRR